MLRIQLGDLSILGRPADGARVEGLYVGRDGFQGWDDAPEGRRESAPRPSAHGSFDVPVLLGDRVVSIDGHAIATTPERLGHLRSRVTGLATTRMRAVVDHQGETLWADVTVVTATFRDVGSMARPRAKFTFQLVAADPRKYAETHRFGAGEPAHHYGNHPATPKLSVTALATMPGYTVVGPGGLSYVVTSALPAGSTDVIDMASGWLYRDGALQVGAVARADVWAIPPGARVSHTLVPTSGAGSLAVTVTDTFV